MSLVERIHGSYVHARRIRVLSHRFANIIPPNFSILDVGCGDGFLARQISLARPDLLLEGIDVFIRQHTYIPVIEYDGVTIPYDDRSFDGVMLVDVLHHTIDPMILLHEALRVSRKSIIIKDHTSNGLFANTTLRVMDRIGNARHHVALTYNYWPKVKWMESFKALGLIPSIWSNQLGLYPWPASLFFDRSLHFITRLDLGRANEQLL
jgi:SAM-dependent methyltransferase